MLKTFADSRQYRISESQGKVFLTNGDQQNYTIAYMELNEWIKTARRHRQWTQQQLGDAVGRSKGNVAMWESGAHKPSYEQIVQISKHTGFPMPERLPPDPNALTTDYSLGGRGGNIVDLQVIGAVDFFRGHCEIDEMLGAGTILGSGVHDGYAVRVRGDKMSPALKDGQFLVLERNAKPGFSDYCILELVGEDKLTFAEFLTDKMDGTLTFEVVETGDRVSIARDDVRRMDVVVAIVSARQWRPNSQNSRTSQS
ncbi:MULTISPECIES: helix-turn-helix domain-containing protein [unclassified Acidovorax]|nr:MULTISPECIES: helix-turn-helix domain-containing protein [unclassified Acidovorax]